MTLNSEMSCRFSSSKTTCFTLIDDVLAVVNGVPDEVKQVVLLLYPVSLQNGHVRLCR